MVNATGVWADRIRPDELLSEEEIPKIRPSRGTHVTISTGDLEIGTAACIVPAGGDRTIFALPWYGRVLARDHRQRLRGRHRHRAAQWRRRRVPPGRPECVLRDELGAEDLTGAYAGVRPLISTGDPKKSVDISRKAELYETSSGMLTITGGKLTTFRRMATQVVDRIVERDGREAECRTDDIPLGMAARPEDLETAIELPDGAADQLAFRYGHAARAVLDLCEERAELAEPIVPGHPDLMAEVVIAARREQARSVGDVLLRRTRLGLVAAPGLRDGDRVAAVARTLGKELGWRRSRISAETGGWAEGSRAEGLDPSAAVAK